MCITTRYKEIRIFQDSLYIYILYIKYIYIYIYIYYILYIYIYIYILFYRVVLVHFQKGPLLFKNLLSCQLSFVNGLVAGERALRVMFFAGKGCGIFSLSLYCSFVMFSQLKTKDLNRKDVACREFDILVSRILLCMTV